MVRNYYRKKMKRAEFERLSSEGTREEILAALSYYVRWPTGVPAKGGTPARLRMRKFRARTRLGFPLPEPTPQPTHSVENVLDRPIEWEILPMRIIRAFALLNARGRQFDTYRDITAVSAHELQALSNVGRMSIDKLEAHLDALGLELNRELPPATSNDSLGASSGRTKPRRRIKRRRTARSIN